MVKLFLLKPDFTDTKIDRQEKLYFCPHCALIEGIIKYYPELKKIIEINYVDFKRPRKVIIDLIGEENQSCPVLIIENLSETIADTSYFKLNNNKLFVNDVNSIAKYLSEKYGIATIHP